MDARAGTAVSDDRSHAFVISHAVKKGKARLYEEWLADILGAVSKAPGYLGREVLRPAEGNSKYTTVVRFDSLENLNAWAESGERRAYVGRASDLLAGGDFHEVRTGVDFWFTPEGGRPPAAWKQFLLTTSAVYPLSLAIPFLLAPLFGAAPALGHALVRELLMAAILTGLLTFVVMPHYTRLVEGWLYGGDD